MKQISLALVLFLLLGVTADRHVPRSMAELSEDTHIARKRMTSNEASVGQTNDTNVHVRWDQGSFRLQFRGKYGNKFFIRRAPVPTLGEPWPMPQHYAVDRYKVMELDKKRFHITPTDTTCDILDKAIHRYKNMFAFASEEVYDNVDNLPRSGLQYTRLIPRNNTDIHQNTKILSTLKIEVKTPCSKYPTELSNEGCEYAYGYC